VIQYFNICNARSRANVTEFSNVDNEIIRLVICKGHSL
jgi:hypothetical protein